MLNALLVATLLCASPQAGTAPAKPAAGQEADRARELEIRYQILAEQYAHSEADWSDQLKRMASYPDERAQLIAKHPVKDYWERFEALAKDGEGRCLVWLAGHADKMFAEKAEVGQRKLALCRKLIDEYASAPWGKEIPVTISLQRHWLDVQGVDDLLDAFVKKTQNREFAAEALARNYALYMSLSVRGEGRERAAALSDRLLHEFGDTEAGRTRFEQISSQELSKFINQPAAPFAGKDVDGAAIDLSALRGKVVLLAFWSAADARGPALAQTLRELLGRHAQDPFVVLGVSSDDDAARFREFAKAQDLRWRSLWEGSRLGPVAQSYSVKALPTLFLIDAAGVIRQTWVGPTDAKTLDLRVEPTVAPLRAGR
jgi:peroxiredoxin